MQFLLIVGSSLLEDRAPMYEIIGSATTICALAWLDVKTAFLGPNATRLRCILPLDGPSREAFVWQGTMPAGVARGMRGLRPPQPRDTHAADVRTITEGEVLCVRHWSTRDAERIVARYAEDATVMAPNMAPAVGREAIREMVKQLVRDGNFALTV